MKDENHKLQHNHSITCRIVSTVFIDAKLICTIHFSASESMSLERFVAILFEVVSNLRYSLEPYVDNPATATKVFYFRRQLHFCDDC